MISVTREKFEELVDSGIKAIPEEFLKLMDNVVIVVEDEPTNAQRNKLRLYQGRMLFGLYEGIPQTKRGNHYSFVIPDKITIFQKSMEMLAHDEKDLEEMVKNTVWHEIAHHFGMDEKQVREAEMKRRGRQGIS